jgi:hypothetical protein
MRHLFGLGSKEPIIYHRVKPFYVDIVLACVQVRLGRAVNLVVNKIGLSFYF